MTLSRRTPMPKPTKAMKRRPMRYNAPPEGSRRWLRDRLDSLTAQIVKMRDRHRCVQCGGTWMIDCGHVYSRRYEATRWDLANCHAQCRSHNTIHISRPELYLTWYQERFGEDALIEMHERAVSGRTFTDDELRTMVAEYEAKLEQLRSDLEVAA
jgi:hypothetical protein